MKLYKLTKRNTTRRGMRWGPGVTNTVTPRPNPLLEARLPQLCTSDVIHAYVHPLQALLHRDHHGYGGVSVKCWEAEGHVVAYDATKVGVKSLTTLRPLPVYFRGWDDNLRRVLALEILKGEPLGHPRTGSRPIKAIKAVVAKFKATGIPPTYAERQALRAGADRIRNPTTKLVARQTIDALSGGSTSVAGTPKVKQATYDKVWPYIQSKLEEARQRDLAKRREVDRARRAAQR